ncbi:putative carbonic anhydrase 5 [Orchesella cincta]|uniref:Carbonic anhydrase n=1 Tax=Orchesella cincta TaxID=48709 RepID=A0A1D2N7M9_ORCCI|nr:putative carbonic anhydrase 5 [Orchesella cincta]
MANFLGIGKFRELNFLIPFLISLQLPCSLQFPQEERVIITDFDESVNIRSTRGEEVGGDWCYQDDTCGESTWAQTCSTGSAQSPINLPDLDKTSCTIKNFPKSTYESNKFMESNGRTVVIKLLDKKLPSFEWKEQKATYIFNSVHLHWGANNSVGSEHIIASKAFSVEMHMVHVRADLKTLPNALKSGEKNGLAVIGVLFEVDPSLKTNDDLQPIVSDLSDILSSGKTAKFDRKLSLKAFMKGDQAYHYLGSLTTPGCNEAVAWLVWKEPNKISPSDLDAFRTVMNTMGKPLMNNFRSPEMANFQGIGKYWVLEFLIKLFLISLQLPCFLQFPQEERVIITDFDESVNIRSTRGEEVGGVWCYQDDTCGESTWAQTCSTGSAQSPINLPDLDKTSCTIKNFPKSTYESNKFSMESNGRTVVIKLLDKKLPSFEWKEQKATYIFNSVHSLGANNSVGSEHIIASKAFSVEMHMVHVRADLKTLPNALISGEKNGLSILSVLFEVDPSLKTNDDLQPIVSNLPDIINPGKLLKLKLKLNLKAFMKGDQAYHYLGSLTTPVVMRQLPGWFGRNQIKYHLRIWTHLGRSMQKTNGRNVTLCQIKSGKISAILQPIKKKIESRSDYSFANIMEMSMLKI